MKTLLPIGFVNWDWYVKQQHALKVYDEDGTLLGDYNADLLVEDRLIVELKAAKTLADEHVAQLLGYLRASFLRFLRIFVANHFRYSLLIACTGSRREARMAGIIPATTPTADNIVLETSSADNDTA
jgi:GxxExxY protein